MDNTTPSVPGFAVQSPAYLETPVKIATAVSTARLPQAQLLPNAVGPSQIAPVSQETEILTTAASVPDGSSAINITKTTSATRDTIIQSIHHQVYIGSLAVIGHGGGAGSVTDVAGSRAAAQINASHRMPEVISSANFPFSAWNSLYDADSTRISDEDGTAVYKIQVRNNSGVTQIISFEIFVRYIMNHTDATS